MTLFTVEYCLLMWFLYAKLFLDCSFTITQSFVGYFRQATWWFSNEVLSFPIPQTKRRVTWFFLACWEVFITDFWYFMAKYVIVRLPAETGMCDKVFICHACTENEFGPVVSGSNRRRKKKCIQFVQYLKPAYIVWEPVKYCSCTKIKIESP